MFFLLLLETPFLIKKMDSLIELFYFLFLFFFLLFLFALSILEHIILKGNEVKLDTQSEEIKVQ